MIGYHEQDWKSEEWSEGCYVGVFKPGQRCKWAAELRRSEWNDCLHFAGTETATWLGDLEILGEASAPLLDDIAWYSGNSGVDFDLPEGANSLKWPGRQYPHTRAGTRKVKLKQQNPLENTLDGPYLFLL